jgi:hypothetical protein
MQTDTRLGTFEEVIAEKDENLRAIAQFLRTLIIELDPDTVEVPRPGERAASYGVGPKKMSEAYSYIMPLADSVNLGFFYGAALNDPQGLLKGTGATMRHIKIKSLDQAQNPEIATLIRESIQERKAALQK